MVKSYPLVAALMVIVVAGHLDRTDGRSERRKRTIGGSSFSRGQFPFLVLMKATIVTRRVFGLLPVSHYHVYCGGVLIADQWLLSAAHCFWDVQATRDPDVWEARMGTVRLRAGIRERLLDFIGRVANFHELRQWEVDVDRIVIHPDYNTTGLLSNDIALVKLSRRIPRRRIPFLISTVPLPNATDRVFPTQRDECVTMGWGCTAPGRGPSSLARRIRMPIRPSRTCAYHYRDLPMSKRLCAGHTNAGIGVCQGDSGSPLVCASGTGYKLAGLVSLTSRHRPQSFPAIFTAVRDYLPWIQAVMARD